MCLILVLFGVLFVIVFISFLFVQLGLMCPDSVQDSYEEQ